ncbi:468_t:CDS:1, partial [Acaulospora morrowiae]
MATYLQPSNSSVKVVTASNAAIPEPTEAMIKAAKNDYASRLSHYTQQQIKRIKSKKNSLNNTANGTSQNVQSPANHNSSSGVPSRPLSTGGMHQRQHFPKQKKQ